MEPLESIWRPHAKQAMFLSCPVYEIMYGGAKGGAKTEALLMDHVKQHSAVHEHWEKTSRRTRGVALIMRRQFPRLKDIVSRSHAMFPILSRGAMSWRENEHAWTCACGYKVEFGHLEGPQDHHGYNGREFSWLGIDQVEEIPWEQYSYMKLQVRTSEEVLRPLVAVRVTANPLGRYADWVKQRFVVPCREGFKIIPETVTLADGRQVTRERVFIPATLRDNPSLPPEYEAELRLAPEHLRRAFLDGDWDVTPGSFFGDVFDPLIHVVDDLGPQEIRIPSNWTIFRCADWGSRAPAACYWVAVDNDGLLIVLDELYGPGEEPNRWGKRILEIEEKWGWLDTATLPARSRLHGVIDPAAMKGDVQGGPTVSEKLFEAGLSWFEGDNGRKAGWAELRRRLMERGGISGKVPGLRIARRCVNLIRTLPNLTSPESSAHGDMDDIDTKQEDHAADALRYGCMSRPVARLPEDLRDAALTGWEQAMIGRQIETAGDRSGVTGY
jgi:Terminase large subunit, T4likevirus-type, N-terminal